MFAKSRKQAAISLRPQTAALALRPMRIFNSEIGDPMLLDTRRGLRALHQEFTEFLSSTSSEYAFGARTDGSPAPYKEFLKGLRVRRSDKEARLCFSADSWLELSGRDSVLSEFRDKLLVEEDGEHTHWYGTPVSLIIEADDDWPGEIES